MIINKSGIGSARPDPNRRTILTSALTPPNDTAAPAQRKPNPEPGVRKRHDARDRMELEAAITKLAADGNGLLDDMEGDDDQDPFDLADRFGRSFDERAGATFAPIADPARKASAFRKLQPVRARLMAAARIMQEEAADRSIANTVFTSAEAVFARAQKDPEETAELLERVAGVIDVSDLTPERKDQVAAAVAARAVTSGLEDMLEPRIKKHAAAGRQLLASLQEASPTGNDANNNNAGPTRAPEPDDGMPATGVLNPDEADGFSLGEIIAQNNVPPLTPPSPEESASDGALEQTDQDPSDFDVEEAERLIEMITGIVQGEIEPLPDNFRTRFLEGLRPGIKHRSGLAAGIDRLLIVTQGLSEPRIREIAARAGLDEDTFVLFHDFINGTPETQSDVKLRWSKRLAVDRSLPRSQWMPFVPMRRRVFDQLKKIAESTQESRDGVVGLAMTQLQILTLLTLSKSPEQDLEIIKHALDPIR